MKENVAEVSNGSECGVFINGFDSWKEGDIIKVFELIAKKKNTF
jgi:translation initiation factor IF-2